MAVNKQNLIIFHVSELPFLGWINRFFSLCVKIDTQRDLYYSRIRALMAVVFYCFIVILIDRALGVKKAFLLRNVWLSKHKEGSHPGFGRHMQHSGSWTISVFTLLVVNVSKTKIIIGAGEGGMLNSCITG